MATFIGLKTRKVFCLEQKNSSSEDRPGFVSLNELNKSFGDIDAVANLNLDVAQGEFFSMLGPSGSGKTTVLRLIAGFETATAGSITIDGEDVTNFAPFDRTVNTVFQDYALFPHMSIQENVEYGLRAKKVSKPERSQLASEYSSAPLIHGTTDAPVIPTWLPLEKLFLQP